MYSECTLCPRKCAVNRHLSTGFCNSPDSAVVNLAKLHHGEEPIISGTRGSGTVFFAGCNLRCVFCQNHTISRDGNRGKVHTAETLSDLYLSLQSDGAHNINLVTPMHFAPTIAESLRLAHNNGLSIPVAVNTGGYDLPETIELLRDEVDIFMPDFKYWTSRTASRYSNAPNYPEIAKEAISKMFDLVGEPVLDSDGMLQKGIIVRHLMLPGMLFETGKILEYLCKTYGDKIYISLMSQYTPIAALDLPEELQKPVRASSYERMCDFLADLGQTRGFTQDSDSCGDAMIPDFE